MGNYEGDFVVVEFDYTYKGTEPATFQGFTWKVEDGNHRIYNYAFEPTLAYTLGERRLSEYEKVNPGVEQAGAVVFEVAPDANDFTLHVKDLIRPRTSKKADVPL